MNEEGNSFSVKATQSTRFIVLSGAPLNEPMYTYGPFVMNTEDQVRNAIEDAQNGKLGTLEETF